MKSILQQLYDGEIVPYEQFHSDEEKYKVRLKEEHQQYEAFVNQLSEEQRKIFMGFMDAHLRIKPYELSETFIQGFRLGARMRIWSLGVTAAVAALAVSISVYAYEEKIPSKQICLIELVQPEDKKGYEQQMEETETESETQEDDKNVEDEVDNEQETETYSVCPEIEIISEEEVKEFAMTTIHVDEPVVGFLLQEMNSEWQYNSVDLYDIWLSDDVNDYVDFRFYTGDADIVLYHMSDDGILLKTEMEADEIGWCSYQSEAERWMMIEMKTMEEKMKENSSEEMTQENGASAYISGKGDEQEEHSTVAETAVLSSASSDGTEDSVRMENIWSETVSQSETTAATMHHHSYQESGRTEATCAAVGKIVYVCSCGDSYHEEIALTDQHAFVLISETEPTCSVAGSRNYQCSTCGAATSEVIEATGQHVWVFQGTTPAGCVTTGANHYVCSGCGAEYDEAIPVTGVHSWSMIAQNENNTYQCAGCGQQYSETNPDYVSWREAIAEEKAQCLAAINAERAKSGYPALSLRSDLGAQAWANHLAETNSYDHNASPSYSEGTGGSYTPAEAGVNQSYTCLGLAVPGITGEYYNANPYIEIGMAYSNKYGSYYYCIRHQ